MAMFRFGHAAVVEPSIAPDAWTKTVCCGQKSCNCGTGSGCRTKVAKTVLARYAPEKYLLSHCSILASVDIELANPTDPKSDYYIHPSYSQFVNNNGDAWSKQMVVASYKTFIGANNYVEHVQVPELAKGKVIDAALREIPIGKDKNGKDLTTYYVDILVATDRKHADLVRKIQAGQTSSLSMGCKIAHSRCSKCGNKAVDETQACSHVRFEKNNTFFDNNGVQRKVAELCGDYREPESVTFIDASWVANPAFTGAVIRNVIEPPKDVQEKIEQAAKVPGYVKKMGDLVKTAVDESEDPAKAPPAEEEAPTGGSLDTPEGEAPAEEAPTGGSLDTPEGEAPAEAPAEGEAPSEGAPAEGEAPAPEGPVPPEQEPQSPVLELKDKLKKNVIQELMDDLTEEVGDELEMGGGGGGPRELDTLDENMIQPTASIALRRAWKMRKSWDNYLTKKYANLDRNSLDRLRMGSYMMLSSNNPLVLKDYGYNRRDMLAVLSCVDGCFGKPLTSEVRKAIASIQEFGEPVNKIVNRMERVAGRKINATEGKKALAWLRILKEYQNT